MKAKEMRGLAAGEVVSFLRERRHELLRLRLRRRIGQVEKSHQFVQLRRDIARAETILKEWSVGEESHG
jgi:large subunit ribosomal protein L29